MSLPRPFPLVAVGALVLQACSDPATAPRAAVGAQALEASADVALQPTAGTSRLVRLTVDNMEREFVVHVGETVPSNAAVPVVFMLHGTSGNGPQFLRISGWREKADTVGLISVFPSALEYCYREDQNGDGDDVDDEDIHTTSKWTQGALGTPAMRLCDPADFIRFPRLRRRSLLHRFSDDIQFFDAMVAWLQSNYRVDPKRIYVTGFSAGGEMAGRLAVERSWTYAALASHAGGLRVTPSVLGTRRVPFVRSVGNRDDRYFAALPGGRMPIVEAAISTPSMQQQFITPYLLQGLLANQYQYTELRWNRQRVGRWYYNQSLVGATNEFAFFMIQGNLHEYPNGTNHPVALADQLWPWFATHALP